ncbi:MULTISPECIES: glycosyltransferase family 2 protein [Methylosinus]|nr:MULTISPECIES: glycosyltransferase family 2 protein [Methylosinus]OBS53392.1 hypothetical protein A8B73_06360 [Methylosinus sp. 3S-1]
MQNDDPGEGRFVDAPPPRLSVVAPCLDEELCIDAFFARASAACAAAVGEDYEIILVDDGSKDATWSKISALCALSGKVVGVRLSRNHGHQLAASAGLAVSRGARILLIDADLQDPPEALPEMMEIMDRGFDVVYGVRSSREGESRIKLFTAHCFYRILRIGAGVEIPRDVGDFRLMTRRVVDILDEMPERHRFLRGMVSWIGGRQAPYPYRRSPRFGGRSSYPLAKMLHFAGDAITSFSVLPLRLAMCLGLAAAVTAFAVFLYALYSKFAGEAVPGWTSVVASGAFFAGAQLFVLGVIGEYIGRLVEQQKGRPLYIIETVQTQRRAALFPRIGRDRCPCRSAAREAGGAEPPSGPHA